MILSKSQRVVIKVGSSLIAPNNEGCSSRYLLSIANFIVNIRARGSQVILVSSGSVAAGKALLSQTNHSESKMSKERAVALKKAMAAAGQTEMLSAWSRLFDFPSAQLLLTQSDLQHHERFISIKQTIENLLENGILPIVNENDAVVTDALRVGDNDNLSAMIAASVEADALIICSDVAGLYDSDPRRNPNAQLIKNVHRVSPELFDCAGEAGSSCGTGGMRTKLEAAFKATEKGIHTVIMDGAQEAGFNALLEGDNPGTLFHPTASPLNNKEHWLTFGPKTLGEVVVADSAINETDSVNSDLQLKDVVGVNGDFIAGDPVMIKSEKGGDICKVKTRQGSCLLQFLADQNKADSPLIQQPTLSTAFSKEEMLILEE